MHKWDPADYQKSSSAQYNWAMAIIAGLKLNGEERILDIGCGDGRITAHLAGLVPNGCVLGIDLSPEMIRFAAGKYADHPNLSFQVGDASELHFNEQFDLVVSFACLHWVEDHLPVLKASERAWCPAVASSCSAEGGETPPAYWILPARLPPALSGRSTSRAFPFPTTSTGRRST